MSDPKTALSEEDLARVLAGARQGTSFLVVERLVAEIRWLRKDLGLEKIIRESAQDTAKRLGNAIDAHEQAAGTCHFPWHQHEVWSKVAASGDFRPE